MYSILHAHNHACKNDNLNMILTWGRCLVGRVTALELLSTPNPPAHL